MFGNRETRLKRAELKSKQQELFADIDNAVANLKVGADAVAAGTFDYDLAGLKNEETINAIIKSNLKNKVTNEGNMAKLSRNEKGELMYTLYRENGELADNPDGSNEPVTMTLKQFNESIATNVKDGGAMMKSFVDFSEAEAKAGNGALNDTYDPERKQMMLNNLDTLLGDKPVNLKRAMRTPIGYSNTSLYDDLTSKGALSAELYGMLNNVSGNQKGELTGGIVDGIEDVDGSGGISASEINYDVLVGNITGLKDAEVSKEFFKQYAVKEMEAAYKYGYSKKPPVPNNTNGKGGPNQFFLGKQYVPAAAVTPDVNILNEDPKDIPARTAWNQAIFRKVDGQYQVYDYDAGPNEDGAFVDVTKDRLRTTLEFSEKVGYDMSGAGGVTPTALEVPADFNKAFRDDEKKVVQYFKNNPSLYPGMKVEKTTSDDPEDGNDTFRITMPGGTSKVFTADPLTGDENKIKDAWTWINNNYVNNEFAK